MMSTVALNSSMAVLPGRLIRDETGNVTGRELAEPCPEVLDSDQVARFLQIDDLSDPDDVLYRLRRDGVLRGFKPSSSWRYLRSEIVRCAERLTQSQDQVRQRVRKDTDGEVRDSQGRFVAGT